MKSHFGDNSVTPYICISISVYQQQPGESCGRIHIRLLILAVGKVIMCVLHHVFVLLQQEN